MHKEILYVDFWMTKHDLWILIIFFLRDTTELCHLVLQKVKVLLTTLLLT